jgi:hypothetical protein
MSFFELPAWRPPSEYRAPAWLRPPEGMVPGIVPVELLLARTDDTAVLVAGLLAYPNGLDFVLAARRRPGAPHTLDRHRERAWDRDLRLEVQLADGHVVGNDPRRWPRTFETQAPAKPMLYQTHGGGSGDRGWHFHQWLWGLPPPGPLVFACEWPARQIPRSAVEIDAAVILEAARRATALWPAG